MKNATLLLFLSLGLFTQAHALEIYYSNGEPISRDDYKTYKEMDVRNFEKISFTAKHTLISQQREYFRYFQNGVSGSVPPKMGVYCQVAFDYAGSIGKDESVKSFEILAGDKISYDRLIKFWGDGSFINSINCSANHENRQVSILELQQAFASQFDVQALLP